MSYGGHVQDMSNRKRYNESTIKIISCNEVTKAHLLKGRLENEGIYSFVR